MQYEEPDKGVINIQRLNKISKHQFSQLLVKQIFHKYSPVFL